MKVSRTKRHDKADDLPRIYAKAFAEYLATGNEDALHCGYEVGRTALANGVSILEVANMHQANILKVVARRNSFATLTQDLDRAQQFFSESLSAYEMARRGFQDASSALHRLNETLEQEIQRIAHAVHDEAGQLLFAARLAMDGMAHEVDPSLRGRLKEIGAILDQVENQLRRLSHELRPTILDDLGLMPALEFLTRRISERADFSIQIYSTLKGRCDPTIETTVYRVIQEALTNVTKHAHAKNVEIRLRKIAKKLNCLVHDDGAGFDVSSALSCTINGGLGLIGMRERLNAVGGMLKIDSAIGRGTDLMVSIPWRSK
jgi:signal transduction histidine kinase